MPADGGVWVRRLRLTPASLMIGLGVVLTVSGLVWLVTAGAVQQPAANEERLAPTALAQPVAQAASTGERLLSPPSAAVREGGMVSLRERVGVGRPAPAAPFAARALQELQVGWYLDWTVSDEPLEIDGVAYVPMVRLSQAGYRPDAAVLRRAAAQRPGSVWLIGNEPDVIWQDNVTPEAYAEHYHALYWLLKEADATCQVAIGGVAQATPLRLDYLDAVLAAYGVHYGTEMPVDVWNVHAFILREEAQSWGVDIPPGLDEPAGMLYDIQDHDDMNLFREQIAGFRQWMKANGQQNKPLIVSEYGIVMPAAYGFPSERVQRFLENTFDFFLTARDPATGYPPDDYRLVQRWCWFSLTDDLYPTGNLVDAERGVLSPLGETLKAYMRQDGNGL